VEVCAESLLLGHQGQGEDAVEVAGGLGLVAAAGAGDDGGEREVGVALERQPEPDTTVSTIVQADSPTGVHSLKLCRQMGRDLSINLIKLGFNRSSELTNWG
jgi:hypothetical protein